jgi:osmotically-inducible protein OsmY
VEAISKTPPGKEIERSEDPPNPLEHIVQARLRTCGYAELDQICVTESYGTIRLSGTLKSFYLKQLAQEAARTVQGFSRLVNDIVVT